MRETWHVWKEGGRTLGKEGGRDRGREGGREGEEEDVFVKGAMISRSPCQHWK